MRRVNSWQISPALVAVAVMFSILVASTFAFAEDTASPPYMDPARIEAAIISEVTVQEKTPVDILAGRQRFAVTPATIITMDGEAISFRRMPVPCEVMVYYEKRKNRDSEAVKIDIKEVAPGADTGWTEPLD